MELPSGKQDKNFWKSHIVALESYSGTLVDYCREHGLSINRLNYYRKKFRKKSQFTEVRAAQLDQVATVAAISKKALVPEFRLPDAKWLAIFLRELSR